MKKKLVNKKVVNSIGVGILAFITATTPVMSVAAEEVDTSGTNSTTTDSGDAEETKQGTEQKSEQATAIENAQETVDSATDAIGGNTELNEVADALNKANEALGNIGTAVDELEQANADVNTANETLAEALADPEATPGLTDSMIEDVEDAAGVVDDEIGDLTEEEIGEAADTAKEKADNAEEAVEKTYDNEEAADAAKQQVTDDLGEVKKEDGVFNAVENAEEALNNVGDQIAFLKDAVEKSEDLKDEAERKAGEAEEALGSVLSEGMKELDTVALQSKLQEVDEKQTALENALKQNKQNIADLAEQIKNADGIEEEKRAELAELVEKLAGFDELNQYEQEKCLGKLQGYSDVSLDGEISVAELISGYMNEYTGALEAHVEALDSLVSYMDGVSGEMTSDAKAALNNAKAALGAAKAYEENCLAAYDQVNKVMDCAVAVQEAQDALNNSTNAEKEALIKTSETQKETASAAYSTWKENIGNLEEAIKEKERELESLSIWSDAKEYWKVDGEIKDLKKELEKNKEANPGAWNNYIRATDELAKTRIEYLLLEEGAKNVDVSGNWVSDQKDNNYLTVKYDVCDKDGNVLYRQTEYFDYTHEGADVAIVRKEAVYKTDGDAELAVRVDNGQPVYTLKVDGSEIDCGEITVREDGSYTVEGITRRTEKFQVEPKVGTSGTITVTIVKEPGKKTKYTYSNKLTIGEYSLDEKDLIKDKNGNIIGVKIGAGSYTEGFTSLPTEEVPVVFNPTDTFTEKGQSYLTESEYDKSVSDYNTAKKGCEDGLNAAKDALRQSINEADKLDENTKTTAGDYLDGTEEDSDGEKIGAVVQQASGASKTASGNWSASKTVKSGVENAYKGIVNAIQSLLKMKANSAETEGYDKVAGAVEKYEGASGKLENEQFGILKTAAATLERIANETFKFNTSSTGENGGDSAGGDENNGGTTGGGTTGGGTTGSGTTTTEGPTDTNAPTVELVEDAVPLAGGTTTTVRVKNAGGSGTGSIETVKADGNGISGGAGIQLEDEEVPLAGLEEEDGKGKAETGVVVEDEETPLAAPIEEQSRMSWWWLILIAVLGVTGEEMYRRHRKKAAEEKELNS